MDQQALPARIKLLRLERGGARGWGSREIRHSDFVCSSDPSGPKSWSGGRPVLDRNREPVYEPGLINVRELLESEDPVRYLGIYF